MPNQYWLEALQARVPIETVGGFGLLIGSRPMNSRAIALLSIGAPRMKNLLGRPMNSRAIESIRDTLLRRGGRP